MAIIRKHPSPRQRPFFVAHYHQGDKDGDYEPGDTRSQSRGPVEHSERPAVDEDYRGEREIGPILVDSGYEGAGAIVVVPVKSPPAVNSISTRKPTIQAQDDPGFRSCGAR